MNSYTKKTMFLYKIIVFALHLKVGIKKINCQTVPESSSSIQEQEDNVQIIDSSNDDAPRYHDFMNIHRQENFNPIQDSREPAGRTESTRKRKEIVETKDLIDQFGQSKRIRDQNLEKQHDYNSSHIPIGWATSQSTGTNQLPIIPTTIPSGNELSGSQQPILPSNSNLIKVFNVRGRMHIDLGVVDPQNVDSILPYIPNEIFSAHSASSSRYYRPTLSHKNSEINARKIYATDMETESPFICPVIDGQINVGYAITLEQDSEPYQQRHIRRFTFSKASDAYFGAEQSITDSTHYTMFCGYVDKGILHEHPIVFLPYQLTHKSSVEISLISPILPNDETRRLRLNYSNSNFPKFLDLVKNSEVTRSIYGNTNAKHMPIVIGYLVTGRSSINRFSVAWPDDVKITYLALKYPLVNEVNENQLKNFPKIDVPNVGLFKCYGWPACLDLSIFQSGQVSHVVEKIKKLDIANQGTIAYDMIEKAALVRPCPEEDLISYNNHQLVYGKSDAEISFHINDILTDRSQFFPGQTFLGYLKVCLESTKVVGSDGQYQTIQKIIHDALHLVGLNPNMIPIYKSFYVLHNLPYSKYPLTFSCSNGYQYQLVYMTTKLLGTIPKISKSSSYVPEISDYDYLKYSKLDHLQNRPMIHLPNTFNPHLGRILVPSTYLQSMTFQPFNSWDDSVGSNFPFAWSPTPGRTCPNWGHVYSPTQFL